MIDVILLSAGDLSLGSRIVHNNLTKANISSIEATIPLDDIEKILYYKPKIIMLNWFHAQLIYDFIMDDLPKIKKQLPNIKVVFCGYNSTYDWIHLQNYKYCDAIIGGEGDDSSVECCKDLLNNIKIDKLKYLKTNLPDLSKYDYENNFIEKDNSLIFETGRSCLNALYNRCWYCSQFKNPYRELDINKLVDNIRKKIKPRQNLVVVTPEILPRTLNRLWKEFHTSIYCWMMPQLFSQIDDNVEGCCFSTGYDIYDNEELKHNHAEKYLDDILRVAKKNKICFSTVLLSKDIPEKTKKEFDKLKSISNNIIVQYNTFIPYPGVDDKPYYNDVYISKVKLDNQSCDPTEEDDTSFYGKIEMPHDISFIDIDNILPNLDISEFKYKSFCDNLDIDIIKCYEICNIQGFITNLSNFNKLKNLCYIHLCNTDKNLIKCVFLKEGNNND